MKFTKARGKLWPQRRVDQPAGPRILLGDPGDRGRVAG
jgi:hypothetical protein